MRSAEKESRNESGRKKSELKAIYTSSQLSIFLPDSATDLTTLLVQNITGYRYEGET